MDTNIKIKAGLEAIMIVLTFFGFLLLIISWIANDHLLADMCASVGVVMLIVDAIVGIVRWSTK